jgi:UDPglucose--hexose-1-phosphate uridylyltransferase
VFALGAPGRAPDTPGWRVRVVPNKYPAVSGESGRTEVVVHSPRHVTSVGDLTAGELDAVASAWRARAEAARAEGFAYVHALLNEGRPAGGSLPHTHSQLVWLQAAPPLVEAERHEELRGLLARERGDGERVVVERDGLVALCPFASRGPYELLVAPVEPEADAFASDALAPALVLAGELVRRLRTLEGDVALNAWLHTAPLGASSGHWHLELVPRLTVAAGLELGAGIYVNPLPPEQAARALRSA